GEGTGIRGTADQFQFTYKALTGNGELVARVVSLDPPLADWSMAGVMIRVLLTPGSPYLFMGVSANTEGNSHGITFWGRLAMDGAADQVSVGATGAPCWVKVKRTGDVFAGYSSPDGKVWTERYSTTAPGIPQTIYIGYAVASEVSGKPVAAVFDNGPMEATSPEPADGARNILTPVFEWMPGITAAYHDIYFGTSPELGTADFRGRQPVVASMYWHLPGLTPGTTYYWRIDEVAADEVTIYPGTVWSCTAAPATAYSPSPWNGLDGVSVDAVLAWTAGVGAKSHDVYFGADKAAVKAGDAGAFKGNVSTATYDPGTLAQDTEYYWRIDERDAGDQVHAGSVWSFVTVGQGIGVQAEYFRGVEIVGDPVVTTTETQINHDWGSGEVAGGISDSVSARWTADLEVPFTETYQFTTTTDDGVRLWINDRPLIDNWTDHGSTDDVAAIDLVGGQFYRLRMEWYDKSGTAVAKLAWKSPSIGSQPIPAGILQLPVHAVSPYPANGAVNAPQTLLLQWSGAVSAAQHDVYFGEDVDAVAEADTTTAGVYRGRQAAESLTFDPGELEWNKTYYWRVDEVVADGSAKGAVWSFTTADFLVIDDFETYTDEDGTRIYQTWLDDYAAGGCGSTVGYIEAPFAEQTIVYGGGQSMPLDYNNVCSPHYSQAERDFDPVQDWTVDGVDTLVLHVRGRASNIAAPLFVELQDKAGKTGFVQYPDTAVVLTAKWTEWKIPLSGFAGVNVARIEKLIIRVGDKTSPVAGSYGMVFIDDIWVVKP
ncbi:MAG: PA14 domain-containing protein, partial [Solirubrobacterales bacterium]